VLMMVLRYQRTQNLYFDEGELDFDGGDKFRGIWRDKRTPLIEEGAVEMALDRNGQALSRD
jgi:hypothetical protein